MTPWRDLVRMLGMRVPWQNAKAMDYLTSRGQVFCVDFGTANAIEKARGKGWRERRRRGRRAK